MNFSYQKTNDGKYVIYGLNDIKDNNLFFLELYNRFERAVMAYGFLKNNKKLTVLELENSLKQQGYYENASTIETIRKTRNILAHGSNPAFTINIEMIKTLASLIIDREQKIEKLKN